MISKSVPAKATLTTQEVDNKQTTLSPYKDSDKESKQSANDIFYRSHVSGFSGIKKKYQAKEGLAMKKREEMKTQFVDPSYT